jgi:hypothetical protein
MEKGGNLAFEEALRTGTIISCVPCSASVLMRAGVVFKAVSSRKKVLCSIQVIWFEIILLDIISVDTYCQYNCVLRVTRQNTGQV